MTTKKKASRKKPSDIFSEVFNRSIEVMGDLASATATTSMNASLTSARYLVKFQKSSMKIGLDLVSKVQDYSEKTLNDAMEEADWAPDEGKQAVEEWSKMMKSGIDEFSRVIDKSFDLLLKMLDRVEKDRKTGSSKGKQSGGKSVAKKSTASKTKTKAKSKSTAKRKSPAKKKSTSSS